MAKYSTPFDVIEKTSVSYQILADSVIEMEISLNAKAIMLGLLRLARRDGGVCGATDREIAALLKTSRQTVSRTLAELKSAGLISVSGKGRPGRRIILDWTMNPELHPVGGAARRDGKEVSRGDT